VLGNFGGIHTLGETLGEVYDTGGDLVKLDGHELSRTLENLHGVY
jgi:hypothetical protein